ncbi:hypothetical protein D3C77_245430 [compost metagenome]
MALRNTSLHSYSFKTSRSSQIKVSGRKKPTLHAVDGLSLALYELCSSSSNNCARLVNTKALRYGRCGRHTAEVKQTASSESSLCFAIYKDVFRIFSNNAFSLWADTVINGINSPASGVTETGGSSMMTWALVPLKPKALIAARFVPAGQLSTCLGTLILNSSHIISGFGRL